LLIKPDFVQRTKIYNGCHSSFEEAEIVLTGAGFDGTASFRSGSKFAPQAIRENTILSQEDYSPYLDKDLNEQKICDFGDVDVSNLELNDVLKRIESVSTFIVNQNKKPFFIGGEHLITLPAVKPLIKKYPNLQIIQFDAHLDLMDVLFGERLSHGTVMRRIYEQLHQTHRIFQVGIRSGKKEEFIFSQTKTHTFLFNTESFLANLAMLRGNPIYISVDLDVFDPSLIPGTGTPEAGGIFFPEFIRVVKSMRDLNIVGGDMVELAPHIDPTHISTIVASQVLRELLLIL
jgi:agmatinase